MFSNKPNLRNINLRFLLLLYYCAFSSCFCNKWLMTQLVLFFAIHNDYKFLSVLDFSSFIKATLKHYFWCLPECLFIQQLFLPFLRTNSLLMLQSSPFKVNITSKIPKFIGFMKSTCIFGHSKEKMDHHASLNHQEYCHYQKYLLQLSGDYKLLKSSLFRVQAFWRYCSILKVQIIFKPGHK